MTDDELRALKVEATDSEHDYGYSVDVLYLVDEVLRLRALMRKVEARVSNEVDRGYPAREPGDPASEIVDIVRAALGQALA